MTLNFKTDSLVKPLVVAIAVAALSLAACGDKSAKATKSKVAGKSGFELANDHGVGDPNAPITVVEYASVTCGHCSNWYNTIWDDFRKTFIDTGKVRYVFREFPTPPVELAHAGHLIANCAPDDKFFSIIGVQFKRQREILTSNDIKKEYIDLAKMAGMNEKEFEACMVNEEENARLAKVEEDGFNMGVTGTPTFFINGKKYSANEVYKVEDFAKVFAEILGEPAPTKAQENPADDTDNKKSEH